MTIDSIATQYTTWTNANGNTIGNNGGVEISFEDDILTFTEADGDTYQVDGKGLTDADIQTLAGELNATIKGADEAQTTEATTADDADLDANKEKKAELQAQWDALNTSAETIKETVEKLSEEIKKSLDEAIDAQKEITEEEQERVKELVSTQIEQFKKDKEAGKDVKMSDLQANIQAGLQEGGFDEEMSAILSDLVVTNTKMVTMDSLLSELGVINGQMKMLDTEMANLDKVIEEQEKAAEEAANCNPCDPIGFKNEDGTTFEFVVDKDGNGELSNFSEFLGSENFFDEMVALDEDGSGDVTNEELNDAGVMVLVKDANGNQELKSIEEAFGGEDVNVNLNSYAEAGEGAVAENGQTLLGNFDISVGDDTYEGYSTLDSAEYLLENYTFTDENPNNLTVDGAAGAEDAENIEGDAERGQITADIDKFIEEYEAKLTEYEAQFESLTELLGLDEELVATIHEFAETQGAAAAQSIIKETEAQQAEENEAVEAEDEQAAVEGAEGAENEEADDEEKEEKEAA